MNTSEKTIFSTIDQKFSLEESIVLEIYKRGGTAHIGSSRCPGEDRHLFDKLAEAFGITELQKQETNRYGKNKWDYTIHVAAQKLKDPARAGKKKNPKRSLIVSSQRGTWELTTSGWGAAKRLLAE